MIDDISTFNKRKNVKMQFKILFLSLIFLIFAGFTVAQEEEEQIVYFQMEPLDDSLFIQIQEQLFIDPPDPKAEIVVDLRDPNNQTISVKGALYPFLALKPEIRARIITYPFKLDLEESIHFGSVFSRVIEKLRFQKVLNTPTVFQISPLLGYINPFLQMMGGERFGIPIKKDIGISVGFGTPYSGALETNYSEASFHILGVKGGMFSAVDAFVELKDNQNHNNLFVTSGYQVTYTVPFGNFFEFGYLKVTEDFNSSQILKYTEQTVNKDNIVLNSDGSVKYQPYLLDGSFLNWEFRYPVSLLGSTRGRVYAAKFLDELHFGYAGRELTLGGSVFDFRFDYMTQSPVRQDQIVIEAMIQKIFDYWAFSTISLGPSTTISKVNSGSLGFTSFFLNLRIKVGSSL